MLGMVSHVGVTDSIWGPCIDSVSIRFVSIRHKGLIEHLYFLYLYFIYLDFYIGWGILELVPWGNKDCDHDKSGTSACFQTAKFACVASAVSQGEQHTLFKCGCLSQGPDWESCLWNPWPKEGKQQIVRPEPDLLPTHPKQLSQVAASVLLVRELREVYCSALSWQLLMKQIISRDLFKISFGHT